MPTFRSPLPVSETVTAVEIPASTSSCCVAATPLRIYVLACGVVVVWTAAWDSPSPICRSTACPVRAEPVTTSGLVVWLSAATLR